MYINCFSNGLTTKGPDKRYDRPINNNFRPSIPRHVASPVKLQKDGKISLCHWSTFWYWYESYTLRVRLYMVADN